MPRNGTKENGTKEKVATLSERVDNLKEQHERLHDKMDVMQPDIASIKTNIENMKEQSKIEAQKQGREAGGLVGGGAAILVGAISYAIQHFL